MVNEPSLAEWDDHIKCNLHQIEDAAGLISSYVRMAAEAAGKLKSMPRWETAAASALAAARCDLMQAVIAIDDVLEEIASKERWVNEKA